MNRMMKPSSLSDQMSMLNDVVVCLAISYLDSATHYEECLRRLRHRKRRSRFRLNKANVLQYGTCVGVGLVVLILLALSWFFG